MQATELLGSRRTVCDEQTLAVTLDQTWIVTGSNDELQVRNFLLSQAPPIYYDTVITRALFRKSHEVEQTGEEHWDCTVHYATPETPAGHTGGDGQSSTFAFDTSGGTTHITQAIDEQVYSTDDEPSQPNYKNAIGETKDSVDGVDIVIPVLKYSETHPIPANLITPYYLATVASLTGTVNQIVFRGFAAGTVLFHGAQGQSQVDGVVPVTYSFEIQSSNIVTIGDIEDVAKGGWQYLWVSYKNEADDTAKSLVKVPRFAIVNTVYRSADWSALGIA